MDAIQAIKEQIKDSIVPKGATAFYLKDGVVVKVVKK